MKVLFLNLFLFFAIHSQTQLTSDTIIVKEIVQNSSIQDFFFAISKKYQINISADSDIGITDNFRFYNISISNLVDFVCQKYNLNKILQNNIIRIAKKIEEKKVEKIVENKPDIQFSFNRLTLNLKNEDIIKVVQELSQKSGFSILLEPDVKGNISGILNNVDFETGLGELLKLNGFKLRKSNSIYKIYQTHQATTNDQQKQRSNLFVEVKDSIMILDVKKVGLGQILDEIIEQADLNVIFYNDIKGDITAKFNEKDLDQLFLTLFRNTDYTFKNENGIYYFGQKNNKDLSYQEIIPLKYLRAGNVKSSGFQSSASLSENTIDQNKTSDFNPQNIQKSNSNVNSQNQTSNSQKSNNESLTATALFDELKKNKIEAIPLVDLNSVLVSGTKQDIEDAKKIVNLLDKPIPQILFEALIIDIKNNVGLNQDIKAYRHGKGYDSVQTHTSYIPFEMLFNAQDLSPITESIGEFLGAKRIGVLPSDFFLFIKMQENKNNIHIKSRPQIATLNGHEAYIKVGQTRYFKLQSDYIRDNTNNNQQTGIRINERYEKLEINNLLRIKPWVSADGDVTVEITPELQSPNGGTDGVPPTVDVRKLESTVRLKNGETIILGGLITEEQADIHRDYFPLLSWIPYLGDLFKSKTTQNSKSELIIYLTPYVYYGDEQKPTIDKSDFK